jgi:L-asparagine transporter-like permease
LIVLAAETLVLNLSKLKIAYLVFGQWTNILSLIAMGTVNFIGLVPEPWVPMITKWALNLFIINTGIMTNLQGLPGFSDLKVPDISSMIRKTTPVIAFMIVALALFTPVSSGAAGIY